VCGEKIGGFSGGGWWRVLRTLGIKILIEPILPLQDGGFFYFQCVAYDPW
jgi:hypothetical protein